MAILDEATAINGWLNEARLLLYQLEADIDTRNFSDYDAAQHGGIGYVVRSLRTVMYDLIRACQYINYGYTSSFNYVYWGDVLIWCVNNITPLTWKSICEAWAANDFEGRTITIAFIDRMRQLCWNEPFYAVWAARPENNY